jgi:hypothetical protein
MKSVIYKDIKQGLYSIDESGNVHSHHVNRILSQRSDKDGYLTIGLMREDGRQGQFRVHALVAATYIGLPPDTMKQPTIDHIDNNRTNNHYSNLRWMELGENSSTRVGRPKGESYGASKLTDENVLKIRKLLAEGKLSQRAIGDMFEVHKSTISLIHRNKIWTHI